MKEINPAHIEYIKKLVNTAPYPGLLSMKLDDIGAGFAEVSIEVSEKHLQPYKVVHGGAIASILDTAAFWSVYYGVQGENDGLTSVDLKLNFLAAMRAGRLIAKGRLIKLGKKNGYAEAEVTDEDGNIIAHGTSTLMVLPGVELKTDTNTPNKFLTV